MDETRKLKSYRTFYVARKIMELWCDVIRYENGVPKTERLTGYVWVKQTQPETGSEVWTPCPVDFEHSDFSKGHFALDIKYCMPPLPWPGDDVPEVYEVRACGVFHAPGLAPKYFNALEEVDKDGNTIRIKFQMDKEYTEDFLRSLSEGIDNE